MSTPEQRAKRAAYMRQWSAASPERAHGYRQKAKARRKIDPELAAKYRERRKLESRRLRANNPQLRLRDNLRSRLRVALHEYKSGARRAGSAIKDLGCSLEHLKLHLETQFKPGMSWENYGLWRIDHKIALANFDLTDRKQLLRACHYENLQPLWAADNRSKGKA